MSGQKPNPLDVAYEAEKNLNSRENIKGTDPNTVNPKHGVAVSDSALESGIDESAIKNFPGATVTIESAASGGGNNRDIPESEGGGINPKTGKMFKAGDFEKGVGAPEARDATYAKNHGGEPDADPLVRQGQGQSGNNNPNRQ